MFSFMFPLRSLSMSCQPRSISIPPQYIKADLTRCGSWVDAGLAATAELSKHEATQQ